MTEAQGLLFADPFHNDFGTWMLGYTPYGGGDYGDGGGDFGGGGGDFGGGDFGGFGDF